MTNERAAEPDVLVVMGVSGSGKSTVGRALARRLEWSFVDADDHHTPENVAKMTRGEPLTDADRLPWLRVLAGELEARQERGERVVLACSALKERYRDILRDSAPDARFVYLKGSFEEIQARMIARTGHFMKADMLKGQFEALEEPEGAVVVPIVGTVEAIVEAAVRALPEVRSGT